MSEITPAKDTNLDANEKSLDQYASVNEVDGIVKPDQIPQDDGEVFKVGPGQAEFRTLGWIKAAIILMKLCFATGVLAIPSSLVVVGYVPGVILLVVWGVLFTYYAYVMYQFRMKIPGIHSIADAAHVMGGSIARDVTGGLFLLTWVLATGSGLVGLATGLDVLADGKVCLVVWTFVAAACTALCASIPTLGKLTLLTWVGFSCSFVAVFVVVVGVTQVDRPAVAPKEGPYDLMFIAVGHPGFVAGLTASINLFAGYGSTPTFMPVIAEMARPKDFRKSLLTSQIFLMMCYVSFGMVMYAYCGQYVASPSLGSAGGTIEKIAYGIAILGLIMTTTLWVHVAAKYVLVRVLRNSRHLQSKTPIHWAVWLGATIGITTTSFVIAEAIPFFSYLVGLIGALCCAPTCLVIPAMMGIYMDKGKHSTTWWRKCLFAFHCLIMVVGSFITVAGTYTCIQSIVDAYAEGTVGHAFSC
ncbi:uncharacterized protein I303_106488 [Kwoniella dejecticola CBS 10117]|uniref:Amino acid transporter transmembrane domain-containing protein n=1 Tax=Kwoniella dejecticola CBS 10117 TaxID=1296121 RepID=A0A1A5ZUK6_9TREE|nr:uncharacterized protein I303_08254 [Kwoniella dejecticola CBS 10117]OBR81484.1 hypothetical protein I303_08254 [Kwoniella dejecticola CBS 10117]